MNRRRFLGASLALGALAATRASGGDAAGPREARGLRVAANAGRRGAELRLMGGRFDLKVSAQDTGGALCIYDTVRYTKGGPPLHWHQAQDEWFYVIRGEFVVQVGDDTLRLTPGDSAFAPRKIPHAFAMTGEGEGQMLVLFQPAGSMEEFFEKLSALGREIPQNMETALKQLFQQHGMEIVGPPLRV